MNNWLEISGNACLSGLCCFYINNMRSLWNATLLRKPRSGVKENYYLDNDYTSLWNHLSLVSYIIMSSITYLNPHRIISTTCGWIANCLLWAVTDFNWQFNCQTRVNRTTIMCILAMTFCWFKENGLCVNRTKYGK